MLSKRKINKQGKDSELLVANCLRSLGTEYTVFNNVMLKTSSGTTQVDHIVISPYGVFVIETKSHKGMLFGDCKSKNWTQCLYSKKGIQRYPFYSPYLQNAGHLKNLYKLTGLNYKYFLGLIVFTNNSVDLSHVSCSNACKVSDLVGIIYSYRTVILDNAQVVRICNLLKNSNIQSKYMDNKHKKYVESLRKGKKL